MSATSATTDDPAPTKGGKSGFLDWIERVGNKVPSPAIMFLYLILFIIVLSAVLAAFGIKVTDEVVTPVPKQQLEYLRDALGGSIVPYDVRTLQPVELPDYTVSTETFAVQSLLSVEGIRFMFSSFVPNFAGFGVVAVTLIAMAGVGVAERAGMMGALIRKLVAVAPAGLVAFAIILVGVLSSVASDAGYLILIPLGAAAFLSVGRHPLAGIAAAFAGVSAIFAVNILITPIDSMLNELTNEAIGSGGAPLTITANYYFSVASSVVLALVAAVVTARIIEPRLGPYDPAQAGEDRTVEEVDQDSEKRGLRYAGFGLLGVVVVIGALSLPPGAPLREPETGALIGTTPLMDSLIFIIALAFLVCGFCYGRGARTLTTADDVVAAISKTYAGLGGLLLMFLMIAQFIAFFNYTNMPRVAAVEAAQALERASVPAVVLLVAMILVLAVINIILPGVVPKWAIFAPVFIPIFTRLGVAPQTVLAAYRVGDGPTNVLTPLMVYLPFIVTIAQRYKKDAGIGTIIALMIPYTVALLLAWIVLFVLWFWLGIPLGPDSPINI
ncbi:MAG TPA: AbgT family transporter [Dermatophilaceae bacterium]|nr:AbgT family transporter [Dermatophilaceae bacterium]